jgi:hypothetical protein
MAKVNAKKIPAELQPFIPYAEKYGETDIDVRERLVENAAIEELHQLAATWEVCIGPISDWLAQPEVRAKPTSDEYLAFTCLILAVDAARWRLENPGK